MIVINILLMFYVDVINTRLQEHNEHFNTGKNLSEIFQHISEMIRGSWSRPLAAVVFQENFQENFLPISNELFKQIDYFPTITLNINETNIMEMMEMFEEKVILSGQLEIPKVVFWFVEHYNQIFWARVEKFKETLLVHARTPFILIITSHDSDEINKVKEECHKLWDEYHILNIVAIAVPRFTKTLLFSNTTKTTALFFNQFLNNGSFLDISKSLTKNQNIFLDKLNDICGYDIKVTKDRHIYGLKAGYIKISYLGIKTFIEHMNGTMLTVRKTDHVKENGDISSGKYSFNNKDMVPDIYGNVYFKHPNNIFKSTISPETSGMTFLLPKAERVPKYMNVILPFTNSCWAAIFCTLPIITLFWKLFRKDATLETETLLETVRLFVSGATILPVVTSTQKCFVVLCFWFSIIFINAYQGSLTRYLTKPHYYPDIATMDQLMESGLLIAVPDIEGSSDSFDVFIEYSDLNDEIIKVLFQRARYVPDVRSALDKVAFDRTHAFVDASVITQLYIELNDYYEEGYPLMHVMKESPYSFRLVLHFPFVSPYQDKFDTFIRRLCESGICGKWQNDDKYEIMLSVRNRVKSVELKPLGISHVQTPFYILLGGLTLGSISLICELLVDILVRYFNKNTVLVFNVS